MITNVLYRKKKIIKIIFSIIKILMKKIKHYDLAIEWQLMLLNGIIRIRNMRYVF